MGYEIQMICEVKKNGKWEINNIPIFNNSKTEVMNLSSYPVEDINYDWFSFLANFRNHKNFIHFPQRGIPDDISEKALSSLKKNSVSSSFLALSDFENFDWNQEHFVHSEISLSEYKKLAKNNGKPKKTSSWVGSNFITVDMDTADKILSGEIKDLTKKNFISVNNKTKPISEWDICVDYYWPLSLKEIFKENVEKIVPPMKALNEFEDIEDVRLVFCFFC